MDALLQSLGLLPVPLAAGLICLSILVRAAIVLTALTDRQRCNRLVRIIKAWRQR